LRHRLAWLNAIDGVSQGLESFSQRRILIQNATELIFDRTNGSVKKPGELSLGRRLTESFARPGSGRVVRLQG
jgi:hypothetical protein